MNNQLLLLLLYLILNLNSCYSSSVFTNYTIINGNYESYGISSDGCKLDISVILDDEYEIKSFSSNIEKVNGNAPRRVYYEGTQSIYQFNILNIGYGFLDTINFNVTNTNNEFSEIIFSLRKSFECKKLEIPLEFDYIGKLYLVQSYYYGFNLDFSISDQFDLSNSFSCSFSFLENCFISKYPSYYLISGSGLIQNEINKYQLSVDIKDYFNNKQTISFDNNIFSYSNLSSNLVSFSAVPANNSKLMTDSFPTNIVYVYSTYSELNSFPYIEFNGEQFFGNLILGAPSSELYFFNFFAQINSTYKYLEVSSQVSERFNLSYIFGLPIERDLLLDKPSLLIGKHIETGNILANISYRIPYLESNFVSSLVYPSTVFYNKTTPAYPYGYSRSISNSIWNYQSESLLLYSTLSGVYSISFGLFSKDYDGTVSISNSTFSDIYIDDKEGPILRSFHIDQLENNKLLVRMNITDSGSGVFYIQGILPQFKYYAKDILVEGDLNSGVYQILLNTEDILINQMVLIAYDKLGNKGLNSDLNKFIYTNLNFSSLSPIIKNFSQNDINYFKFDRHQVDTSFDSLELTLTIGFKGASEYSIIPRLIVPYNDYRLGLNEFKGFFNKTTGMFDIKINVQARERGIFSYIIILPPIMLYNQDFESLFPSEKVLLTANYVDHFPPQITYFKSITDTNLIISNQDEIEIGWEFEVYDYPVGLDYGTIEVVSNVDFEPRVFTIKPDTSIPGSDIKSNYTISFKVKSLINQAFYISKVQLFDKNGYYSQYPVRTDFIVSYSPFFSSEFRTERIININITSSSDSDQDSIAPELLLFNSTSLIDSYSYDRNATFNFSLRDSGSGISLRHNPYVYIQLLYASHYRVQSELVSIDNDTGIHYYKASVEFEYGSLLYGAIVSIHGITDNSLNVVSFTSQQLADIGFKSSIVNIISHRPPVILDYSTLNEDGGKLFIYGKEFTDTPIVYMNKGDGFTIVSTSFISNLAITVKVPSVKGYNSIQFKVLSSKNFESNIITITPIINPIIQESNCTSLNNCNGKGQCINSKCVCITGYSGLDCSSISTDVNNTKPNETPSISTFGSMININQIEELDINGKVINSYFLEKWNASTVISQYQDKEAYQYITRLNGTNTNITITIDIFNNATSISFASNQLRMDKGTIKYTISLDSYEFSNRFNTLQLKVNASLSSQDAKCKLNSIGLTKGTDNIEFIKLRSDDKSIYGKFIQNAVVDYRSINIQNKLLVSPTNENQNAIIGIQIPFYYENALLDPDFSVIFDVDDLAKNKDSTCFHSEIASNTKLSKTKVIIISIVCSVVFVGMVIACIYFIKTKSNHIKFMKKIELKSLSNNK